LVYSIVSGNDGVAPKSGAFQQPDAIMASTAKQCCFAKADDRCRFERSGALQ
jgi:hypothetical protein